MPIRQPHVSELVKAFAEYGELRLTASEQTTLEESVGDTWSMAEALRTVEHPGLRGQGDLLPRRSAYANAPSDAADEPTIGGGDATPTGTPGAPAGARLSDLSGSHDWTVERISRAISQGEATPFALVDSMLERIAQHDEQVRSFITVAADEARRDAYRLTEEHADRGARSLLHGVTVGFKDNIPATGMPCTYNSRLTKNWTPRRDAEVVRRLRAAGTIVLGKHNLNEFGWSIPNEDDLTPPPRNPWMPEEYSVGSSSGGGAAAAARLSHVAIGTDGGGSIRLPAGQHMLFGLKPTHDRIPRHGVSDGSVSEIGILARSAVDAAIVLAAVLVDPGEPGAAERLREYPGAMAAFVGGDAHGVRVGIPQAYLDQVGMEDDIRRVFDGTLRACEACAFTTSRLPEDRQNHLADAVKANFVTIAAEHFADHERPGTRNRAHYGESAGRYNLYGAFLSAADYLNARRVGSIAREQIDAALQDVDVLLMPTSPVTRSSTARNPRTHRRGGNAAYTSPFNISGHPAVSLPAGASSEGMPIGMQLVGRFGEEFELLRTARLLADQLQLPPFPEL